MFEWLFGPRRMPEECVSAESAPLEDLREVDDLDVLIDLIGVQLGKMRHSDSRSQTFESDHSTLFRNFTHVFDLLRRSELLSKYEQLRDEKILQIVEGEMGDKDWIDRGKMRYDKNDVLSECWEQFSWPYGGPIIMGSSESIRMQVEEEREKICRLLPIVREAMTPKNVDEDTVFINRVLTELLGDDKHR